MKFSALTGLRGVFAVLVAISHLNVLGWVTGALIVQHAYLFVDFFFVLSGFVIAYSYVDRLKDPGALLPFMIRRFGRVYPLHFAVLMTYVGIEIVRLGLYDSGASLETAPFTGGTSVETLASNLVLAHSIGLHASTSWNYPSWSISTEFYTYILFAVLAVVTVGLKAGARIATLAGIMIAAALVPMLNSKTGMFTMADFGLYRCIYGFIAGVLTFLAYRASLKPLPKTDQPALASEALIASMSEIICVITAFAFVTMAGFGRLSFAAPIVFAVCIFIFADEAGPVSKLLRSRPIRYLGEHSYSIYMVHSFVAIHIVQRLASIAAKMFHENVREPYVNAIGDTVTMLNFGDPLIGDLLTIAYVAGVIGIAHFTYRWIEVPGRAWFNAIADRHDARRRTHTPSAEPELVRSQ